MEIFNQFDVIGLIIRNLFAVSIFCVLIIYFDQTRKEKVKFGDKVPLHE